MKRAFDIGFAALVLVLTLPLWLIVIVGIRIASPGPVFYRATRAGRHGTRFAMLKFRSMHEGRTGAAITAHRDPRVFGFGALIRRLKLDELPQLLNVLRGEMSIVGPRPEDPAIVAAHYSDWMMETLRVRPGMTGPGSVFYYSGGEALVDPDDPEGSYAARLLPPKLAIERAYMDRATLASDLIEIARTAAAVIGVVLGRPVAPDPRDLARAAEWVAADTLVLTR